MKNLIKILILAFGIQYVNAQVFQRDSTYIVIVNTLESDKEASMTIASLVLQEHPEIVVTTFEIEASNRIEHIQVQSIKNPELKDVDDIIRVDLSYSEPYPYIISQYILMTNEVESILLSPIVNIHDSNSNKETVYVFPNQVLGNTNKISKMQITYEDGFEIEHVNVLQNYVWNDSF